MTYAGRPATSATDAVRAARDFLLHHPHDYDTVVRDFAWPRLEEFNFALEWFDVVAGEHPDRAAVTIVEEDTGETHSWSYGELARRSDQVASWLVDLGMRPGDKMVVMLNNTIELWEILMALMKVGAVAIPTSTLLNDEDLAWRIATADARFAIAPVTLADCILVPILALYRAVDRPTGAWRALIEQPAIAAYFDRALVHPLARRTIDEMDAGFAQMIPAADAAA